MKAIILLGGLGTRLQKVVSDVPKPMAPIQDKPFLAHLLRYLSQQGVTSVIFSVCYLWEKIFEYFQYRYLNLDIEYAKETLPLGTGGAIINALSLLKTKDPVWVINGDTMLALNYQQLYAQHQQQKAYLTLALQKVKDCSRYGKVVTENNIIIDFKEKGEAGEGLVSAGTYLVNPEIFSTFELPEKFSFETDFMMKHLATLQPHYFATEDYFIDIGIPEDYERAKNELGKIKNGVE
jgi:D-glycero-alpha-D-manno-heptose 1-phosphate guanylyltransferase